MSELALTADYRTFVEGLKERVRAAQIRAAVSVNQELVLLYWRIGKDILARQAELGWGRESSSTCLEGADAGEGERIPQQ